jgi:hypothetical protein
MWRTKTVGWEINGNAMENLFMLWIFIVSIVARILDDNPGDIALSLGEKPVENPS